MTLPRVFCAMAAVPLLIAIPAVGASTAKANLFIVDGETFVGRQKVICVIEGHWRDGERFHYEAWDKCVDMSIKKVSQSDYQELVPLGENNQISPRDIPPGTEVLMLSNAHSQVLVFRDSSGTMREILVGD